MRLELLGRHLQLLGLHRNHYDRFVHTLFGLLLTVPFREVLLRTSPVRGRWSYVLPVAIVMALSAGYEICEWIAGVSVGSSLGDAFLGAQGDPWDSQEDMACAAVGAMVAASLLQRNGFDHVSEIAGGIAGWEAAKLPVQTAACLS